MTTFQNPAGAPSVPVPATVANAREAIFAKLEQRLSGQMADPAPAEAAPPAPLTVNPPIKEPALALAPEEPAAEVAEESVAEEAVPAPAPVAKSAAPPKTKLSKSMEIQRRAEAAVRRARTEAGKLRTQAVENTKQATATDAQATELERAKAEVARLQGEYSRAVQHLKDNPLEFAKVHGVDPASLAAYVASGADPTQRQIENIRRENAQTVARLKAEYDQKINAIQESFVASQEVTAQQNFFQFVEESKTVNPEAFAALGSDLVYSPKEIWDTANHLLETRADLRDNFDEDKLLEAVEAEARKDPRWIKVQDLQRKAKQNTQSNAVAKPKKPNVSEVEEAPAPVAAQPRPLPKRDATGQFQPGTPHTRHAAHLEGIIRRARLVG